MAASRSISTRFTEFLVALLVKEQRSYHQRFPHDLAKLRETLRPGDVVLVEGSQRISEVIKYLTQSSWSHAALYVGDAIVKRGEHQASIWRQRYGDEASALLVEANVEDGVTASTLAKYANHNLRICRPINLRPGDLSTVLDTVITQIGSPYNRDHIQSLLWYFLPVELMPKRWRAKLLESSGRLSKEVICSTQIAMAFQKVRYPIQPEISEINEIPEVEDEPVRRRRRMAEWVPIRRRRAKRTVFETRSFIPCDPSLVTPRDFDLSPYFEVVKIAAGNPREFDYKKIHWSSHHADTASESAGSSSSGGADKIEQPGSGPTLGTAAAHKTG